MVKISTLNTFPRPTAPFAKRVDAGMGLFTTREIPGITKGNPTVVGDYLYVNGRNGAKVELLSQWEFDMRFPGTSKDTMATHVLHNPRLGKYMNAVNGLMGMANCRPGQQNMRAPSNKSSKLTAARLIKAHEELFWPYGSEYEFVEDELEHLERNKEPDEWVWHARRGQSLMDRCKQAAAWEQRMERAADGAGRRPRKLASKSSSARAAHGAASASGPVPAAGTTVTVGEAQRRWERRSDRSTGKQGDAGRAARRLERIVQGLHARRAVETAQAAAPTLALPAAPALPPPQRATGATVSDAALAPALSAKTAPVPDPTLPAPASSSAPAPAEATPVGAAPVPGQGGSNGAGSKRKSAGTELRGAKVARAARGESREKRARAREGDGDRPLAKRILRGASGPVSQQS